MPILICRQEKMEKKLSEGFQLSKAAIIDLKNKFLPAHITPQRDVKFHNSEYPVLFLDPNY
jgi:hypothetical protein